MWRARFAEYYFRAVEFSRGLESRRAANGAVVAPLTTFITQLHRPTGIARTRKVCSPANYLVSTSGVHVGAHAAHRGLTMLVAACASEMRTQQCRFYF